MDRTVPSYRIATEIERSKWKIFRQGLGKKDKKEFDKMFSYSRLYNSGLCYDFQKSMIVSLSLTATTLIIGLIFLVIK